ncbi:MAG: AbrB/MazE/SpoVT family DNA-binding domain-containing protein [Candidatus Bipolaricaulota bacterium]
MVRNGQITLPAKLRKALDLDEGDYLEVEVEEGNIVLGPKLVVDKHKAQEELSAVLGGVHQKNEGAVPLR